MNYLSCSAVHKNSVWPASRAMGLVLRVVSEGEVVHHKAGELLVIAAVAFDNVVFKCREGHTTLGALRRKESVCVIHRIYSYWATVL